MNFNYPSQLSQLYSMYDLCSDLLQYQVMYNIFRFIIHVTLNMKIIFFTGKFIIYMTHYHVAFFG